MLFYYILPVLNIFCIYHIYRNRNEYYWILIVLFVPYVGSLLYLVTQVFSKSTINVAQEGAFKVLYPGKRIKDLEKKLDFSDTFENKVALADAYLQNQRFEEAIKMYLSSLKGHYENDYYVISNLIVAYFKTEEYNKVIEYTEKIKNKMEFRFSRTQFLYAKSLEANGNIDAAEEELRKTDTPYKNYEERYYLARFLAEKGKKDDAREITSEILTEAKYMQRPNRRKHGAIIQMTQQLQKELS